MAEELTEDEQRVLVDQFEEAHRRSQTEYDSSVRTIAAAAVGVTASLVAALRRSWVEWDVGCGSIARQLGRKSGLVLDGAARHGREDHLRVGEGQGGRLRAAMA